MPAPAPKEAHVVQLEVFPKVRTLALGQTQRFTVKAVFDDGTKRDVTGETVFTPSEESVVAVSPSGEAKVNGLGEGAVLIRYQGLVAVARVISPFSTPRTLASKDGKRKIASSLTPDTQHPTPALPIDRLVSTKLTALGLETSGKSTDSDFLRRAYLDAIGILPTPDEVRAFLADHDTSKREKLIDVLLERPEYVDFWTLKWGDILRSSSRILNEKGMYAFNHWLRRSVAENKPWNQFAQELLLAKGSALEGPANFFRTANSPQELAETTSQVFLGVRIQCAKCHNHPYEKWTQNQYYQMAAFFARVHSKQGDNPEDKVYYTSQSGEVTHPKTKNQVIPAALDAAPITADFHGDRRQPLVDWLTSAKNPFFSHILVNRVWRHFMGRGFVEPVDDLRATNPPSNEALFDWLAQDFAAHNFDLKYLMRSIMLSQTYQRSAEPTKGNDLDTKYYSHYPFKRLGAEQLMDAISTATGVPEKFGNYPKGMRAAELPDTGVESYFLDLFGRPARQVTCECERQDAPNVGQVLHLMNSKDVNDRITAKTGRVAQLLEAKAPFPKLMEELYLTAFSRFPTAEESTQGVQTLTVAKDKQKAGEDLLWVLLNSKEFIFSH